MSFAGTPIPNITWYMGKKEIKESRYFKTSYLSGIARLEVSGVYPEDQGEYLCVAENDAGRAQSKCDSTVLGKHSIILNYACTVYGLDMLANVWIMMYEYI